MSTDLTKAIGGGLTKSEALENKPAFLANKGMQGTEQLSKDLALSYLKVIQKQSDDELLEKYGAGCVILQPDDVLVWKEGDEPVTFVPLFYWLEYQKRSPRGASSQFVFERSLDRNSDLAAICEDRNREDEPCEFHPEGKPWVYTPCYNYIVLLRGPGMPRNPVVMQFASAESKTARSFNNKIVSRQAPLFSCVFEFTSAGGAQRKNDKGSWKGLDIDSADDPWITDESEFNLLEGLSRSWSQKFEAGLVSVHEDKDEFSGNAAKAADVDDDETEVENPF